MITFVFDHPLYTKHTYNLAIQNGKVYVYAIEGTPLGIVDRVGNTWQQTSGREFHHEMALAIGEFLEQNSYL